MTGSAAIYHGLHVCLTRFYLSFFNDLMDSFGTFLHAAVVIYIIYVGYSYALNEKDLGELREMAKTAVMLAVADIVVFNSGSYFEYVIEPVFQSMTDILVFFFGHITDATSHVARPEGQAQYFNEIKTMTDLFTGLDLMFVDFIKSCQQLLPSGWTTILSPMAVFNLFGVVALLLAYGAMYLCFTFMFIMSFFMMWLLFYLGGIYILMACFKPTRGYFFTWCKQVLNYALIAILTAIVVAVCYSGISSAVFTMSLYDRTVWAFTSDFLSLLVWCFICLAITLKVPDIAAGLTSQMAGSTAGIAGALSMAGGAATSMAGAGMVGLGKGYYAGGKSLYTNRREIAAEGKSATEALKYKMGIKDPFGPR